MITIADTRVAIDIKPASEVPSEDFPLMDTAIKAAIIPINAAAETLSASFEFFSLFDTSPPIFF